MLASLAFAAVFACASADRPSNDQVFDGAGPVPRVDFNPTHSVFLTLAPEHAGVLSKGGHRYSLMLSRTNSMEGYRDDSPVGGALHAETTRLGLEGRWGLGQGTEVALIVPMLFRNEPAMDGFIAWVEDTVSHRMPARRRYQDTPAFFEYRTPDGRNVDSPTGSWGFGDLSLALKKRVAADGPGRLGAALRLALKIPTGDVPRGFGSGTYDAAMALTLQKQLLSWLIAYANVGATVPLSPSPNLQPFAALSLALEALLGSKVSVVLQSDTYTSPYRDSGLMILDGRDDVLTLGVRYTGTAFGQKTRVGLFAAENFNYWPGAEWSGSADDFTVGLTFSVEPVEAPALPSR